MGGRLCSNVFVRDARRGLYPSYDFRPVSGLMDDRRGVLGLGIGFAGFTELAICSGLGFMGLVEDGGAGAPAEGGMFSVSDGGGCLRCSPRGLMNSCVGEEVDRARSKTGGGATNASGFSKGLGSWLEGAKSPGLGACAYP